MPGFYVAFADATGARIIGSEVELSPAPAAVDYPTEPLATFIETADQRLIVQQPTRDGRRRSWIWKGYWPDEPGFARVFAVLERLRSRYRIESGAPTPYVYLKEDITREFTRPVRYTGTATGGSASTLVNSTANFPNLAGFQVEILTGQGAGQCRTVLSNTATTLTLAGDPWTAPNSSSSYVIFGRAADWARVRVVGLNRSIVDNGGFVRYPETTMTFVIDDATWDTVG